MLIWQTAFHCEAKPVIDQYRLKKSHADHPFDLYRGEDNLCIVSGGGKLAAAAAGAWLGGQLVGADALAWINLGIAGAAEAGIGTAFQLDQIIDADSGQRYYPVPPARGELPTAACITLASAEDSYHAQHLHDMEASGFFFAATRFSSAELVQAIKIISDNREQNVARDRARVSSLIADCMPAIAAEAERQQALAAEMDRLQQEPALMQPLCTRIHFSQTQLVRLRRLLQYLDLRGVEPATVEDSTAACRDGSGALAALDRLCRQDSEAL